VLKLPDNFAAAPASPVAARVALMPVPKSAGLEHETSHARLTRYWPIVRRQAWKIGAFVAASLLMTFVVSSKLRHVPATSMLQASGLKASGRVPARLEELRARSERSMEAVARLNAGSNSGKPEGISSNMALRLRQLSAERENTQADLLKKRAAYSSVKSGSSEAARTAGQADALQRLEERINEGEERSAEIKASKGQNDPDYQREQLELQEVRRQVQALSLSTVGRAEVEYNRAAARERVIEQELAQTNAEFDRLNADSVEYQQLQQKANADKKLYEDLEAKSQEASREAGTQNTSAVVSSPASPSNQPMFPNLPLNLGLAGVLSCFLAIGTAVLLDSLDKSIRDPEEVRRLFGTELIGTLPVVKDTRSLAAAARRGRQTASSMSSFEEAIRMLRNSILLSEADRSPRSILVTSASPGEGKSTAAMHVAMAHAQLGKKTLLIDADLRRPTLAGKLGISDAGLGLSGALLGETDWQEAVVQVPEVPNLHLLPAGSSSSRGSELIGGSIAEVIDEAAGVYDLVIVDASAILPEDRQPEGRRPESRQHRPLSAAEPTHIAIAVDAVVVVASACGTNSRALRAAVATLNRLRANLIGIALNRLSPATGSGSRYW
jgi:polysaccharide biosynthesis transport protein